VQLRDHSPLTIEEFNGLWKRSDKDSVPPDHFSDCNNIQFVESGFESRDGLDTFVAKGNIVRHYNYKMQTGESLLALDNLGNIWHALIDGSNTIYGPILSISTMTDFGFVAINGRAYITPFTTFTDGLGVNYQKGIQNEFVYVYKGDGTSARKAAGNPPTNGSLKPFVCYNSETDGGIEPGVHLVAVAFTDGVDRSATLGEIQVLLTPGGKQAHLNNIPLGGAGITGREIYVTKVINPKDYDPSVSYPFFLEETLANNTDTELQIDFTDAELVTPFAAGALLSPSNAGALTVRNSTTLGGQDFGQRVIAVVYETDTGFLTAPGPETFAVITGIDIRKSIDVSNIPVSPDSFVVKRHLVSTKVISDYNGDQTGFQFFFIPGGNIDDNTTTTKNVAYYDADLLDDASHLLDNFSEIPAGVTLATYNGRMLLTSTFTDISLVHLSAPGEPEAIDQVDGNLIVPLDGNPITNAQEFRDVLYVFKKTRTYGYVDNDDVPSTWSEPTKVDMGIGASVHGVAQVLDSDGVNIDFLLIVDFSGIMVFNGAYQRPELTWKIQGLWYALARNDFANIQLMNDSLSQMLYMTLPDRQMLIGDYKNGLDPMKIRWSPWSFNIETNTIALVQTNVLVIGSVQAAA
jgi:hypothetical protein